MDQTKSQLLGMHACIVKHKKHKKMIPTEVKSSVYFVER